MACFGFYVIHPCLQGHWRGALFRSVSDSFQCRNLDGQFCRPPPPGKMAHFCLLAGFILDFATGDWGCFTCFKIVDQTRKCKTVLLPSVSNDGPTMSEMSFFFVRNPWLIYIGSCGIFNFERDKPLLPCKDFHETNFNRYSLRLFILFSTTKTI